MKFNRDKYFTAYKLFVGKIPSQGMLANMNVMLDSLEKYSGLFDKDVIKQQVAYLMATFLHETPTNNKYGAGKEVRQVATDTPRRKEVRRLQDRYWNTGYYGRGPIQITWERNYRAAQTLTGAPLLRAPDLLLRDLSLGYEIAIKMSIDGLFTGKALRDYINNKEIDYFHARRVVNGLDSAAKIADCAEKFYKVLTSPGVVV